MVITLHQSVFVFFVASGGCSLTMPPTLLIGVALRVIGSPVCPHIYAFLNTRLSVRPLTPPTPPALASRMASSGGEGHRQARSQTMPIIRGKNALTNPKLLQMMETGNAHSNI